MILVFDIGNTETTIGLFDGEQLRDHWRVVTEVSRTPDEIDLQLRALLSARQVPLDAVNGTAIGSVVPALTGPFRDACQALFGHPPVIVDARSSLPRPGRCGARGR
jgi:type III pantothenate kinase